MAQHAMMGGADVLGLQGMTSSSFSNAQNGVVTPELLQKFAQLQPGLGARVAGSGGFPDASPQYSGRPAGSVAGARPWMPTVQQVPAFGQQPQQQQLHSVQESGRLMGSSPLLPSSAVSSAAAAAAMSAANQAAQNSRAQQLTGRTMVPLQAGGAQMGGRPQGAGSGGGGPASGNVMRPATNMLASGPIMRPTVRIPKLGTVATYNPATGVRSSPMAASGASANSALGGSLSRTMMPPSPSAGSPHVAQLIRQLSMPAQQHQNLQQQRPNPVSLQHLQALQNLRAAAAAAVVHGGGNNAVAAQHSRSGPLPTPMPAGQAQVVNVTLANGTTTTAVLDQATISRLLEAQAARSTVMKVPVPNTSNGSNIMSASGASAPLNVSNMQQFMNGSPSLRSVSANILIQQQQQQLQQQQQMGAAPQTQAQLLHAAQAAAHQLQRNQQQRLSFDALQHHRASPPPQQPPNNPNYVPQWTAHTMAADDMPARPGGLMRHVSAPAGEMLRQLAEMQQEGFANNFGGNSPPGSPHQRSALDVMMLAEAAANRQVSPPPMQSVSSGSPRLGPLARTGSQAAHVQHSAPLPVPSAPAPEEFRSIIACIGVELARHGISVETALAAGWLGVLSPADVQSLAQAYAEEERRMHDSSFSSNVVVSGFSQPLPQQQQQQQQPLAAEALMYNADVPLMLDGVNGFDFSSLEANGFAAFQHGFFDAETLADADALLSLESHGSTRTPPARTKGPEGSPGRVSPSPPSPLLSQSGRPSSATAIADPSSEVGPRSSFEQSVDGDGSDASVTLEGCTDAADEKRGPRRQALDARFANLDLGCGFF